MSSWVGPPRKKDEYETPIEADNLAKAYDGQVGKEPKESKEIISAALKAIESSINQETLGFKIGRSFKKTAESVRPLLPKALSRQRFTGKESEKERIANLTIEVAHSHQTRKIWGNFIQGLDDGKKNYLIASLHKLEKLGLLDSFVNVVFVKLRQSEHGTKANLFANIDNFLKEETLSWLGEKQHLLAEIDPLQSQWGFPSLLRRKSLLFDDSLRALGFMPNEHGQEAEFFQVYENASPLGKYMLLQYAYNTADYCDKSITSLLNSTHFDSKKEQVLYLTQFLTPYKKMMEDLISLVTDEDQDRLLKDDAGSNVTFDTYKKGLTVGKVYLNTQDMLVSGSEAYKSYEVWKEDAATVPIPPYGPMTCYFQSRGFDEICEEVSSEYFNEAMAARELQGREYFTLSSFVPGSNVDRSNKVHWPSRLLEYFNTFDYTVKKVLKNELTRYGLLLQDLPKQLRTHCLEFQNNFEGLRPASIIHTKQGFEVVFDIPLRQHAAQVSFEMHDKGDNKVIMNVKAMAGDEGDRWKRTAVLASLMAHKLELSFVNGIPPKINYNHTDEVSFSVEIPAEYGNLPLLMRKMRVMIRDNTMVDDPAGDGSARSGPERYEEHVVRGEERRGYKDVAVTQFRELFGIETIDDWKDVPGMFFSDSLYLNLYLLDQFVLKEDIGMVEKIVRFSLAGLKQYNLSDYTGRGITPDAELYRSEYSKEQSSSLITGIVAALEHLKRSDIDPENRKIVNCLLTNVLSFYKETE